ncbi:MAG: hypothetical protein JWQ84_3096 [Mucilaginibacter sp.]|nr:hypothetical protein [Mucilaginibacter sp.]
MVKWGINGFLKNTFQISYLSLHLQANCCSLKSLRNYSIPFTGLKLGKHQFEFIVTDAFFDEFEYSLVKKANLKCQVELERQETMLILNFQIDGTIDANCDRCLAQYPQQVDIREQQVAKFSEEPLGEDEEIIILTKNDHEINIAGLIYEYINVAMPFITVCNDEGNTPYCDKEMLDSLNKLTANTEQNEKTDPRWDALKKFK